MTGNDFTPRVWVGCLACYNEGHLVGNWYDAIEAGDVTVSQVHRDGRIGADNGGTFDVHEELWCFDVENMPQAREMSPSEAQEIAETVDTVDDDKRGAFLAYLRHFGVDTVDHHAVSGFEDSYAGEWESFREYADETADESMRSLAPSGPFADDFNPAYEWLTLYFDWDKYASELEQDHGTEPAPDSRVYVFRSV